MHRPAVPRRRRAIRPASAFRPQVGYLEDRLPPGDALLSGLLGAATLATAEALPTSSVALTGALPGALPVAAAIPPTFSDSLNAQTPPSFTIAVSPAPAVATDSALVTQLPSSGLENALLLNSMSDPLVASDPFAPSALPKAHQPVTLDTSSKSPAAADDMAH